MIDLKKDINFRYVFGKNEDMRKYKDCFFHLIY